MGEGDMMCKGGDGGKRREGGGKGRMRGGRTQGRRRWRRGVTVGTHVYCTQEQPAWEGGGRGVGGRAETPRQPAAPESQVSVCSRMTGDEGSRGYGGSEEDGRVREGRCGGQYELQVGRL